MRSANIKVTTPLQERHTHSLSLKGWWVLDLHYSEASVLISISRKGVSWVRSNYQGQVSFHLAGGHKGTQKEGREGGKSGLMHDEFNGRGFTPS